MRSRARAGRAGAHELGQAAQTGLRHRHRTLPELRRQLEDHRRHRRSAGDCQNPRPSGPAHPRPAARPCAAIRSIPDNLRAENRLPTQADGAARSEFERAARSGTLRAPPTAAPSEPAEATAGFSSNRKTIDIPPVQRYCSGQKKRWFKIPIQKDHSHAADLYAHQWSWRGAVIGRHARPAAMFVARTSGRGEVPIAPFLVRNYSYSHSPHEDRARSADTYVARSCTVRSATMNARLKPGVQHAKSAATRL